MSKFDYAGYFGPITPLADALRERPTRFWEPTPERLAASPDYVLYLGCNVLRTVHLAESIVAVLEALGVDFLPIGGPAACCGIIHHRNGDAAVSTQLTGSTLAKFTRAAPKAVLTYCPSCHAHMDARLPGPFGFDLPYLHVTEFLAQRVAQLPFQAPLPRRVALHMHQGGAQSRADGEHVLTLLRAIPQLEVVPLPADEAWGLHCNPQQIATVGGERFAEMVAAMFGAAREAQCDAVVAVYHSCYRELLPNEAHHGLEFLNYVELLTAALGLGPFPATYKALKLAGDPEAAYQALEPRARGRRIDPKRLRKAVDAHFAPPAER